MDSEQTAFKKIIASLENGTPEELEDAVAELHKRAEEGLNVEEGITALKAATKEFALRKHGYEELSVHLVRAAAAHPQMKYVPVIAELYPKYDSWAKKEVLKLLAALEDEEAAVAYMNIVRDHARGGAVPALPELQQGYADVFFPALLDYADIQNLEWDIYVLLLSYFQRSLFSPEALGSDANKVLDHYRIYKDRLMPAQQKEGVAWMWEEEYHKWRERAALILDILGYIPTPEAEQELREALTYDDPKLKFFGVVSLLRLGKEVDSERVREVALSAEMRNFLYDELLEQKKASLFPPDLITQSAFAESNMVDWLTWGMELGQVPDEIELMKVVSKDTETEDGIIDHYVFRFRTYPPHWAAKDGWMAGISGFFPREGGPYTHSGGDTFSCFEPWDSMTPEEHVAKILKVLQASKERYRGEVE